MRVNRLLLAGAALLVLLISGGTAAASRSTATQANGPIVIGATNFTEQAIVANLYALALKNAGIAVTVRGNLGAREEVYKALQNGSLDLYPEYAGSLLIFLAPNDTTAAGKISTDLAALKPLLAKSGIVGLNPAPAVDENVFAVTQATATKYHLSTLSDLKAVAPKLILGGPPECPTRPLCELGLEKTYGLHFKSFKSLDESGPITIAALKGGEVQVAELFSSEVQATVTSDHFVELADNKGLQPADHLIPIIRKSFDSAKVTTILNAVSAKLTTAQLSNLNSEATTTHDSAPTLAAAWLKMEKLK